MMIQLLTSVCNHFSLNHVVYLCYICTSHLKMFCEQGQILCLSRLEDAVKDAEFIFEAVVDDLAIKQDIFESKLDHI